MPFDFSNFGKINVAIYSKDGAASLKISGGSFRPFTPVLLSPCTIDAWDSNTITIRGSSHIRLFIEYDRVSTGGLTVEVDNAVLWVCTGPHCDPINGPPDADKQIAGRESKQIDAWFSERTMA